MSAVDTERRRGHRRFQDLLRALEQHRLDNREVGEDLRYELVRRGIRIPSESSPLDLMALVIDAELPFLEALDQDRRRGERRGL